MTKYMTNLKEEKKRSKYQTTGSIRVHAAPSLYLLTSIYFCRCPYTSTNRQHQTN